MEFKPHKYQSYTIEKIKSTPKCMLVLDMGLGKTVSTLSAINDLMFNSLDVNRVLVIAPIRVANFTWDEEVNKWSHLTHLRVSKILGTPKQRINALNANADIYTINRENVEWLINYYIQEKRRWDFDCIVVDESSSFKNNTSKRFKALRKVTSVAKRVILLTGTPTPNGLMDLWPQIYLLDKGARLESTITKYRDKYFRPGRRNGAIVYEWIPRQGSEDAIYEAISDICISMKAEDYLVMPERIDNFCKLKMDDATKKVYKQLERDYVLDLDEKEVTATSAGIVVNKLLQLANGAVYTDDHTIINVHDIKLDALEEILEDNPGKPIMVFYNYRSDLERLYKRFGNLKPRELNTSQDKTDWDNGRIRLLLAHPASMGHGLNLQSGGSIIVWFGMNWSLELYQQANARLYRQGQKETVVINHLIIEGSVDELVVKKLKHKDMTQEELIAAIKALGVA